MLISLLRQRRADLPRYALMRGCQQRHAYAETSVIPCRDAMRLRNRCSYGFTPQRHCSQQYAAARQYVLMLCAFFCPRAACRDIRCCLTRRVVARYSVPPVQKKASHVARPLRRPYYATPPLRRLMAKCAQRCFSSFASERAASPPSRRDMYATRLTFPRHHRPRPLFDSGRIVIEHARSVAARDAPYAFTTTR